MELLKDYDCMITYHLGKANIVEDALSRRTCSVATIIMEEEMLYVRLSNLDVSICEYESEAFIATSQVEPNADS